MTTPDEHDTLQRDPLGAERWSLPCSRTMPLGLAWCFSPSERCHPFRAGGRPRYGTGRHRAQGFAITAPDILSRRGPAAGSASRFVRKHPTEEQIPCSPRTIRRGPLRDGRIPDTVYAPREAESPKSRTNIYSAQAGNLKGVENLPLASCY